MTTPNQLFPATKITIAKPLPTTASASMVDGKLRFEFELDIAAAIGLAVLAGKTPDLGEMFGEALSTAAKDLIAAIAANRGLGEMTPKGEA